MIKSILIYYKNLLFYFFVFSFIISIANSAELGMIADIQSPVTTEFAEYVPNCVVVVPSVKPYVIADDFSNVANIGQFSFSDVQKELLRKNGFVAIPSDFKEMYDIYNKALNESLPIFVTVDSVLHAFHKQFDDILRSLETRYFYSALQSMTQSLLEGSIDQLSQSTDPQIQNAIRRNIAYFSVANQLINPASSPIADVASIVAQEMELIQNHAQMISSPLFGTWEDYTQYVPRGHYTLSEKLKRYFLAMTWYGRITFHNRESPPLSYICITREMAEIETRQALLIVQLLNSLEVNGEPIQSLWERIYQPTVFLVGQSDDLNLRDYTLAARSIYGLDFAQLPPDSFADPNQLAAFMEYPNRPASQISPIFWGVGYRLMGQRFLPDGYIAQTINPGTSGIDISGLEIMAVLGSDRAFEIIEGWNIDLEKHHQLREEFTAYKPSVWAQSVYWNWLYCLMPVLALKGEGFPTFMQSEAWRDKDLSCALGSWAELRHDTILYAKPVYYGGLDDTANAFETEYVEPNPWAFARLAALSRYLLNGLGNLDLLPKENDYQGSYFTPRLQKMLEVTETLQTIAEKELTQQPITIEERRFIRTFGDPLAWLCTIDERGLSSSMGAPDRNWDDMAVIADVFTNTETGTVVEVGVGRPLTIYTVIGTSERLSIAVGSAFSYYEFFQPMNERLTDEAWRKMLDESKQPALPYWTQSYAVPVFVSKPPDFFDGPKGGFVEIRYTLSPSSQYLLQGDMLTVRLIFDAQNIEIIREYEIAGYKEKGYVEKLLASLTSSLFVQIDVKGQLIEKQLVFDESTSDPYDYSAVFDTANWPKGDYMAIVYNPSYLAITATKIFTLFDDPNLLPSPTPTPTRPPTPTPTPSPTRFPAFAEIAENTLIVTDDIYSIDNLLGSFDVDDPDDLGLAIRWKFPSRPYVDFHVYVSVDSAPMEYLGRTGNGENSFLEWRTNRINISNAFVDGPQFKKTYRFAVYGLLADETNDFIESNETVYLITTGDPTPTMQPTPTPTFIPVFVDQWRLYE